MKLPQFVKHRSLRYNFPSFSLLMRCSAVFVLLVALSGCGGGSSSDSSSSAQGCGSLNARIFGGEVCSQQARSPVVAMVAFGQVGDEIEPLNICTGALVTVDDFVTSAHCFTQAIEEATRLGLSDLGFAVLVGGRNGEVIPVVRALLHPSYDGSVGSPFDIAMATLSRVPNPPIGPLPVLLSELTLPGSAITAFGYGTNDNQVDVILKAANFTVSEIANGNLVAVGDGRSSLCSGDSGGPAVYVTRSGIATIAAVNSFGDAEGCINTAGRFSGFVDLQNNSILEFMFGYAPDISDG